MNLESNETVGCPNMQVSVFCYLGEDRTKESPSLERFKNWGLLLTLQRKIVLELEIFISLSLPPQPTSICSMHALFCNCFKKSASNFHGCSSDFSYPDVDTQSTWALAQRSFSSPAFEYSQS